MDVIDNELFEIYTTSEDAFSVGILCFENSELSIFINVDPQGVKDGYYLVKHDYISDIQKDTEYLDMIKSYICFADKHPYTNWFNLRRIKFDDDVIKQVLNMVQNNNELITIKSSLRDEIDEGYITVDEEIIHIRCVNVSNAKFLENVDIEISSIDWMSFCTLDQILLDYAYKENL